MSLHRLQLWFGALIVIAAAGTASPILWNDWTQDDVPLVREDARIHDLGNIRNILTTPFWPAGGAAGHHRPMTTLTLAVEWAMGGGATSSFRIMSMTILAAASLAVFILALELLPFWWAVLVGLAFAIHPVHVEAVAVAINQAELLIGGGYALVLAWYIRVRRQRDVTWRDRIVLMAVIFIATLYKETGVVLPGLLVAAELCLLADQSWRKRLAQLRPTVLLQVLAVMIVVWIRDWVLKGETRGTFTAEGLEGLGLGGRALTMLGVVPEYLRLLLWPASLQADYSPGEIVGTTSWGSAQSLGALILILVVILAIRTRKSTPVVPFGLAWIAIGIAPVHNVLVPSGIVLAERTLFLPSIGAMLVVAGLVAGVMRDNVASVRPAVTRLVHALLVVAVVLGASRSWSRYHVWRTQLGLWTQTVIDAPDSYRAWVALGSMMQRREVRPMGFRFTERAMAIYPSAAILFGLAEGYQGSNHCDLAIPHFQHALRLKEFAPGRSEYLSCLTWEGEYDLAYAEALQGVRSGYGVRSFLAWRRWLEEVRREQPRRHTRFAPPNAGALMTTEAKEPGVWQLQPPLPPLPR